MEPQPTPQTAPGSGTTPDQGYYSLFGALRVLAICAVIGLLLMTAAIIIAPDQTKRDPSIVGNIMFVATLLTLAAFHWHRFGRGWIPALGLTPLRRPWPIIAIALAWTALAAYMNSHYPLEGMGHRHTSWWNSIFFVALLGPLAEELIFRQTLYKPLLATWRHPLPVAIVTALLWSGMHYGSPPRLLLEISIFGLILAEFRRRYGTLLAPLLAHCLHNGILVVMAFAGY